MRLDVIKCHGSGNDFPMVDGRGVEADWPAVAVALADRAGPVGGDGLLVLTAGDDFGMRMWNPDGSESETCLNGLRCVARWGMESLGLKRATVKLITSSAEVALVAPLAPGVVTISERVGPAELGQAPALPSARSFTAVAMPNPHLVSFVERIDDEELSALGRFCESRPPVLPGRANVSFVEVRGADALFVRTFERGVGLTNACGSAMAASTYAACLSGRMAYDLAVTVFNAGGRVRATASADAMVTVEGNATFEWRGSIDADGGDLTIDAWYDDEIAAWESAIA